MDATQGPEAPPQDLAKRLDALAQQIFDSAAGALPAEVSMKVRKSPGGLTHVDYHASLGDFMAKGVAAQVMKFGPSPEQVAADVIATAGDRDIARRIRTEKLHELARELGYELSAKPKKAK